MADREFLQRWLGHADPDIVRGAAQGLLASHGLADFAERIWQQPIEALTTPQRLCRAVKAADGDINNGGISQFFFNSSGDTWPDAIAGFEAFGCAKRARILRDAVGKFGREQLSLDRELRQEQLAQLVRKDEEVFEALTSEYFETKEDVETATASYAIANADAFLQLKGGAAPARHRRSLRGLRLAEELSVEKRELSLAPDYPFSAARFLSFNTATNRSNDMP